MFFVMEADEDKPAVMSQSFSIKVFWIDTVEELGLDRKWEIVSILFNQGILNRYDDKLVASHKLNACLNPFQSRYFE